MIMTYVAEERSYSNVPSVEIYRLKIFAEKTLLWTMNKVLGDRKCDRRSNLLFCRNDFLMKNSDTGAFAIFDYHYVVSHKKLFGRI